MRRQIFDLGFLDVKLCFATLAHFTKTQKNIQIFDASLVVLLPSSLKEMFEPNCRRAHPQFDQIPRRSVFDLRGVSRSWKAPSTFHCRPDSRITERSSLFRHLRNGHFRRELRCKTDSHSQRRFGFQIYGKLLPAFHKTTLRLFARCVPKAGAQTRLS